MTNEAQQWEDTKIRFPKGTAIDGTVVEVRAFGAFIEITDLPYRGILVITAIEDSERSLSESDFPEVGTQVRAVVVGHRDSNRQLSISTRESDMKRFDVASPAEQKR